MDEAIISAVFQAKPSRQEAKADVTSRIAREIIDSEVTARESKTERLRAARLAREAAADARPAAPKPQPRKPRRKG